MDADKGTPMNADFPSLHFSDWAQRLDFSFAFHLRPSAQDRRLSAEKSAQRTTRISP
jgi:hypothetical protein